MIQHPTAMRFGDAAVISPDGSDHVPAELSSAFAALTLLQPEPDLLALWVARLEAALGVEDWHRRAISAGGVEALRVAIRADHQARGLIVDEFSRIRPDMAFPGEAPPPAGHPLTVVERDAIDGTRWRRASAIRSGDAHLAWFLVRTATRMEARAEANLIDQRIRKSGEVYGFAVYVPRLTYRRRVGPNRIRAEMPLFGGYLFVGVGPGQSIGDVVETDGVHDLVKFDGKPRRLAFEAIAALVRDEVDGLHDRTRRDKRKDPEPGTPVSIIGGMFAGWPARFVERREDERIALLLTMFGRDTPYALDPEDVELPDPPKETKHD